MKKTLLLTALFSLFALTSCDNNENEESISKNEKIEFTKEIKSGKIVIKYKGGFQCWMGFTGCEGEIVIEWGNIKIKDTPNDVYDQIKLNFDNFKDYEVSEFKEISKKWDKKDFKLPSKALFDKSNVSDGSYIEVPEQILYYSKTNDSYYGFSKRK